MSNSFKTFLKHTAKDFHNQSVNPPIVRASTIIFKSMQDIRKTQDKAKKNPTGGHFDYGRQGTSTTHILQQILSKLEESYFTFLTPTGFGSVFLAIFSVTRPGDEIIATGYKIGLVEFGGFGEIVHLPSEWVVKLPENLSLYNAMCHGTAGITAAECVNKIIKGGISNTLPVLVSGATGGVGSIAVGLLSKLGYEVHAITGKPDENEKLTSMGATKIISRNDFMSEPLKPLDKASYSSAVDTVGGETVSYTHLTLPTKA